MTATPALAVEGLCVEFRTRGGVVRALDNVEGALACELLGALVATDLRRPLRSGAGTHAAHDLARRTIAPLTDDRAPAPDIAQARRLIASGELAAAAHHATDRGADDYQL